LTPFDLINIKKTEGDIYSMAKYNYVVLSNPVAGHEDEYNEWYTKQHLGDVLKVPGFVAAQRFKAQDPENKLPHKYMAIYEIDTNDVEKTLGELAGRAGSPAMPMSPAFDIATVSVTVFEPITGRVVAK